MSVILVNFIQHQLSNTNNPIFKSIWANSTCQHCFFFYYIDCCCTSVCNPRLYFIFILLYCFVFYYVDVDFFSCVYSVFVFWDILGSHFASAGGAPLLRSLFSTTQITALCQCSRTVFLVSHAYYAFSSFLTVPLVAITSTYILHSEKVKRGFHTQNTKQISLKKLQKGFQWSEV